MPAPIQNLTPIITAAKKYIGLGWAPVPVPKGEKGPKFQAWQNTKVTSVEVDTYFSNPEGNIAVIMGELSENLVDVDIDCVEGLSLAAGILPDTLLVFGRKSNPSSHLIFQCEDKSPETGKFSDVDGSVLIELRSDGHATNFPPSTHPTGELYEFVKNGSPGTITALEISQAVLLLAVACLATRHWPEKGSRHQAALAISGILARASFKKNEIVNAMALIAKAANDEEVDDRRTAASDSCDHFAKGLPVSGMTKVREVFGADVAGKLQIWLKQSHGEELNERIARLNEKHAVVMSGGSCRIMNMGTDTQTGWPKIDFSSERDFNLRYAHEKVITGFKQNGEPKSECLARAWLTSPARRQYDGVIFSPGTEVPGHYNQWLGFAVEPIEGNCDLFMEHLHQIVCADDEEVFLWLLAWMADAVQNPATRPGTAVVLRGKQGTGKSCICGYFGKLFGSHYKVVSSSKHLIGNFNAHLSDALIVLAEEAFWAGEKAAEGVLKDLVTGDTLRIERKHMDVEEAPNYIRLMVASNHDWVIPAGLEERRFLVLDVSDEKMQNKEYFSAFIDEMHNGGREALLHFLLHHDYSDVDLRTIPKTEALFEQKLNSMTAFQKFWFNALKNGYIDADDPIWRTQIPTEDFRDRYYKFAGGMGTSHKGSETDVGLWIKKVCPKLKKQKKVLQHVIPSKNPPQKNFYVFPDLETCRALFNTVIGIDYPWSE